MKEVYRPVSFSAELTRHADQARADHQALDAEHRLALLVLDLHNRQHDGAARWCTHACCRHAHIVQERVHADR